MFDDDSSGFPAAAMLTPERANVLIVDDDAASIAEVSLLIQQMGHRSLIARTWTEALRVFLGEAVDLILMDAVMPTVDGFKLTRILRTRAATYVPIVFLTGLADRGARAHCVAAGADDFLSKPVDPFELQVRTAAMLRIRRLTQALEAKTLALSEIAHLDGLTKVANRRAFDARIGAEIERARRYSHPLSLLMIDIDHFKQINDRHGHAAGDSVLKFLGALLTRTTRACDFSARFGGEEFSVIAPETRLDDALVLAERLREAFEVQSSAATDGDHQTLSIGIGSTEAIAESTPAALIQAADEALYAAKAAGRNRVVCCDGRGRLMLRNAA